MKEALDIVEELRMMAYIYVQQLKVADQFCTLLHDTNRPVNLKARRLRESIKNGMVNSKILNMVLATCLNN